MSGRLPALVLLLCLALAAPALVDAQPTPPPTTPAAPAAPSSTGPAPPIFQYALAGGLMALILTILCTPTRKSR
ncbi:MAG: hypothetical protein U0793_16265 [Gemmataceae bacterium]